MVPGLGNSGPAHWQTRWEEELDSCFRVPLGLWDSPLRRPWVTQLNWAIERAGGPVVLVAHSLGCLAVAHWAAMAQPAFGDPVVGVLLVAPPDVDIAPVDPRVADFSPAPLSILPFPSILVASRDDPWCPPDRARRLAGFWGSEFADAGDAGHINADSDVGIWPFGQFLLSRLLGQAHVAPVAGLPVPTAADNPLARPL
jgi:predicted alpha/beta hydrolase family esterase